LTRCPIAKANPLTDDHTGFLASTMHVLGACNLVRIIHQGHEMFAIDDDQQGQISLHDGAIVDARPA